MWVYFIESSYLLSFQSQVALNNPIARVNSPKRALRVQEEARKAGSSYIGIPPETLFELLAVGISDDQLREDEAHQNHQPSTLGSAHAEPDQ